jgi:uncharacterized repeat protein (TIGR02543 family)
VLFSTGQKEVLKKIDEFRLIIDGETTPADSTIPFRFFIGNMDVMADWNGTAAINAGAFATQTNNQVSFNANKMKVENTDGDRPEEPRIQAYILQQRVGGNVDVTIRSIKLRYDQDIGGLPPAAAIKISYDRNYDGAPLGPNPAILSIGDKIGNYYHLGELPVLTRPLYEFKGWFTQASGGTQVTKDSVYGTTSTIYAQWEALPVITISYDLNYTTTDEPPEDVEILKDAAIGAANLPTVYRAAYFFKGWSKAAGGGEDNVVAADTGFSADATLYAQWESAAGEKFTVTFNKGYTDPVPVITTVDVDVFDTLGSAMPSDPAWTDFEFVGWYTGLATGTVFKDDTIVTGDITVYARWAYVGTGTGGWEEKLTIVNASAPVYAFELPAGDTFGNYDSVKFLMKLDSTNATISARKRAWGNYTQSWLNGAVTARPGMDNASPGGLLLNNDGVESINYSEWTEVTISFNNRDTLSTSAGIKGSTGIILLGVSFIPAGGSTATYVYYVKDIQLVDSTSAKSPVSALHPASKKLWNGQGASAYVTQNGADVPTRVWSFSE